jgi:hypothetical protein
MISLRTVPMAKHHLITLILLLFLPNYSYSFEGTSFNSFSKSLFDPSADIITTNINAWVITSSTFGDMYSKLESASTATKFRSCDCGKSPDLDKINYYVEKQYKDAPKEFKKKLIKKMAETKRIEEQFRLKTFNPNLSDKEIIRYAKERERMLLKAWEMEIKLIDILFKEIKPDTYWKTRSKLIKISSKEDFLKDDYVSFTIDGLWRPMMYAETSGVKLPDSETHKFFETKFLEFDKKRIDLFNVLWETNPEKDISSNKQLRNAISQELDKELAAFQKYLESISIQY